ncbi:hypothetical protein V2J09_007116 [Rumex salicifolius]
MIAKVLGRNVTISALDRRLRELWKPRRGIFSWSGLMARAFDGEDDFHAAMTSGSWKVFGTWTPEFDPFCGDIVTTPVWVRISNLPVNSYHRDILRGIAARLGNPVKWI